MSRALARSVHQHAKTHASQARQNFRGEVEGLNPFSVAVLGTKFVLDDDDFDLTQSVRRYDKEHGIEKGDNVVLLREAGQWLITDVVSDSDGPVEGTATIGYAKADTLATDVTAKFNDLIDALVAAGIIRG